METERLFEFINILLDIGEKLLLSGGEVSRVENTLSKMAEAYGTDKRSVFVITSNIVISLSMPGGIYATDTRRILKSASTDFFCLEKLNSISREYCKNPISNGELRKRADECEIKVTPFAMWAGSVLAAGAFSVFFEGSIADGIVAAVLALVICFFKTKVYRILKYNLQFNFLVSFIVGMLALAAANFIPSVNADKVIIGDIMLLIPGLAMTNSVRDILAGDTISGVMRFVESLMWALGLAIGIMLSIFVWGCIVK